MQGIDFNINANVAIRCVDKNTAKYKEWYGHNLATKTMALGIFKFLRGDFDIGGSEDSMKSFYPFYLVMGNSNNPVTFEDTSLGAPLYEDGSKDSTPPYTVGTKIQTIDIGSNGFSESTNTLTLPLRFYVPTNVLDGTTAKPTIIKEVGLYTPNHQLCARFVLDTPIEKKENDFIDVVWEISITTINENT